jgi:hypothetical protein
VLAKAEISLNGEPWEKEMVTSHGRMLLFFGFHVFAKTNGKFYTAFGDYFIEGKFWSEISQNKMPTPHLLFLF